MADLFVAHGFGFAECSLQPSAMPVEPVHQRQLGFPVWRKHGVVGGLVRDEEATEIELLM